jgi:CHASE2 domain-containing sensor protein/signal transduction histidine kinase
MIKSRLIWEWSLIVVGVLGAILFAVSVSFGHRIDNLLYDQISVATAPPASSDIILVEIDDRSLAQIGAWPWPRSVHARLIDVLNEADPKAIGYDILFNEPTDAPNDLALQKSIAQSGKTIIPAYLRVPGENGRAADIVPPIPEVKQAAAGIGHVNVMFDEDGVVRRLEPQVTSEGDRLPHFTVATFDRAFGKSANRSAIYTDPILVPFQPVGAYSRVSFSSVLNREVPAGFFTGKIVLVGATAQGMRDSFPVPGPAGGTMSGVELQANMLNGLITGRFVEPISYLPRTALTTAPVLLLLLSFWFFRPTSNFILSLAAVSLTLVMSILLLAFAAIWFPPTIAVMGIALAYPLWSWRRLTTLSAFIDFETQAMRNRSSLADQPSRTGLGLDSIAQSAAQLKLVMGQIEGMKDFMAGVIANAPDALCVLDKSGTVILANDAARRLFPKDAVGRTDKENLATLFPATQSTDGEIILRDGRVMLIDRAILNPEAPGEAGAIWRLVDVTSLREAAQEREEMLEFLSHDMRSPQASIITIVNQAKGSGADSDMLTKISGHAKLTLKLADDFVQLARLSTVDLHPEDCDLTALMNEAIDGCYAHAQEKKVSIVRPAEAEILVHADPWPIMRALTNLIDNAIKYSPALTTVKCVVGDDGSPYCSVTDEGPGVPEERRAKIFKRFGSASTNVSLSSGLGLAFVQKTMDRQGGEAIYTDLSPGSCFTLRFNR